MDNIFQSAGTSLAALLSRLGELDGDDLEHVDTINRALFHGQHCASQLALLADDDDPSGNNVVRLHTTTDQDD